MGLRRASRRSDPSEIRRRRCVAAAAWSSAAQPGIGKSRLLREAVRVARPERFAVRVAAANIASSGLPFGGLAQMLPPDPPAGLLRRRAAALGGRRAAGRRRRPAAACSPSTTPTCSTRRPPRWCTCWSARAPRCSARCAPASRCPAPIAALWTEDLRRSRRVAAADRRGVRATCSPRCSAAPVEAGSARSAGPAWPRGNPLLLRELVHGRARRRRDDPGVRALALDRPARPSPPAWPTWWTPGSASLDPGRARRARAGRVRRAARPAAAGQGGRRRPTSRRPRSAA